MESPKKFQNSRNFFFLDFHSNLQLEYWVSHLIYTISHIGSVPWRPPGTEKSISSGNILSQRYFYYPPGFYTPPGAFHSHYVTLLLPRVHSMALCHSHFIISNKNTKYYSPWLYYCKISSQGKRKELLDPISQVVEFFPAQVPE